MDLLEQLKCNKGTVSSALGKELALEVLNGDKTLLEQAIDLVTYDLENQNAKGIRAGAAKILEKVAEKRPDLLANQLDKLEPALTVKEPQTRWMLMQVFGYCAKLNPGSSKSVLPHATRYLTENAGVCLSGAVYLYLGRIGSTSAETANTVLPILDDALKTASENEIDWILEGFLNILDNVDPGSKQLITRSAEIQTDAKKKSTRNRAMKIIEKISDNGKRKN